MPWKPGNPGEECCEGCTLFNGVPTDTSWTSDPDTSTDTVLAAGESITYNDTVSNTQISASVTISSTSTPFSAKIQIGSTWAQLTYDGTEYTFELSTGAKKVEELLTSDPFTIALEITTDCIKGYWDGETFQQFFTTSPTGDTVVVSAISGTFTIDSVKIQNRGTSSYGYFTDCPEITCIPPCQPMWEGERILGIKFTVSGFPSGMVESKNADGTRKVQYSGLDVMNGTHIFLLGDNPEALDEPGCWVPKYTMYSISRTRIAPAGSYSDNPVFAIDWKGEVGSGADEDYIVADMGDQYKKADWGADPGGDPFGTQILPNGSFGINVLAPVIPNDTNYNQPGYEISGGFGMSCYAEDNSVSGQVTMVSFTDTSEDQCGISAACIGAKVVCEFIT